MRELTLFILIIFGMFLALPNKAVPYKDLTGSQLQIIINR